MIRSVPCEMDSLPRRCTRRRIALCALFMLVAPTGCSKESMDKLVTKVQEQSQTVTQSVTQSVTQEVVAKIAPVGTILLSLNGEVTCPSANATLLIVGDGRPNVFQMKSYASLDREKFPSVLFQAPTTANTLQALVGQSLRGELHVALDGGNALWQSNDREPVELAIKAIEETEIVGQINRSTIKNPENKDASVTGSFRAVMTNP